MSSDWTRDALLFVWRRALTDSNLNPTRRLVAFTLSLHMDAAGGSCWPSLERVAHESGLSLGAVKNALNELEAGGWIERNRAGRGKGGRGKVTHYVAKLPGNGHVEAAFRSEPATSESETGHPRAENRLSGGQEYFTSSSRTSPTPGTGHQKTGHAEARSWIAYLANDLCLNCGDYQPLNSDDLCQPCWTGRQEAKVVA
jgi:hypothetical protein